MSSKRFASEQLQFDDDELESLNDSTIPKPKGYAKQPWYVISKPCVPFQEFMSPLFRYYILTYL